MNRKITYIVCATLMGLCSIASAQQSITKPVINSYAKVTAISISNKTVTCTGASTIFNTANLPDTVLLIQMTGIKDNNGNDMANAGRYEFHIVTAVSGNTITLKSTPGSFDPSSEHVQLIRVPSYKNATVAQPSQPLSCKPWSWSDGTGGVLALFVEGTLTLSTDIDISGLGFKGGGVSGTYDGICSFDAPYNLIDYPNIPNGKDRAGYKGEGAHAKKLIDDTPRGQGAAYNGGGGGNGQWAGGGGGANGGGSGQLNYSGGKGDYQASCDPSPFILYNNGGRALKYTEQPTTGTWSERAFMGGGGGSGTGSNTLGGNGGGVVIIVAEKIDFNGRTIKANGNSVGGVAVSGGAGGGGAGGSLMFSVVNYEKFKGEISGGKGGDTQRSACVTLPNSRGGTGGGGSGGLAFFMNDAVSTNGLIQNLIYSPGQNGVINTGVCSTNATPGSEGSILYNFQIQLRGFLFNCILTPDTTACNNIPLTFRGSKPRGGNNVYAYEWQYSGDRNFTSLIKIKNNTSQNYTDSLRESGYLRRKVTSGQSPNEIIDYSTPIQVTLRPEINTIVLPLDTVCANKESLLITGNTPSGGTGVNYTIQWQEYKSNTWENIAGANSKDLTVTSFQPGEQRYKRLVTPTPPGCSSPSNEVKFTVLSNITNNIEPATQNPVCENDNAAKLKGLSISGGNGKYNYQWQVKSKDLSWKSITGATSSDYDPKLSDLGSSDKYGDRLYQRIVTSSACQNNSNSATVHYDQQSSPSIILTPDKTGKNALDYQFSMELNAENPEPSIGTWSSEQDLVFDKPNSPTTKVSNLQFDINTISWKVENGACKSAAAFVKIEVKDIDIPNGFSPNGDGTNDCFKVVGAENATSSELVILNRYNNVVYESTSFKGSSDIKNCSGWWDGRDSSGKELPSGTYFYQLTLNGDKVYKGYVVLKK